MVQIKVSLCLVGESRHLTAVSGKQTIITEETSALLTSEHAQTEGNFSLYSFLFLYYLILKHISELLEEVRMSLMPVVFLGGV